MIIRASFMHILKIPDAENRDWARVMQACLQMAEHERFIQSVFSTVQYETFFPVMIIRILVNSLGL